jgi:2-amino-4-ketopentanoate thiolase alpha subunit
VSGDETATRGRWVEVGWTILEAGERAPQVPEDTASVPLEARACGWLDEAEAAIGANTWIRTAAGRRLEGRLLTLDPAPGHGFGEPVEELLTIGPKLRARLRGVAS